MKTQKDKIVESILNTIPNELIKSISKMNQRKLVKLIIDKYGEFISDTLVTNKKFIIPKVGKLSPVRYKIGAKLNSFTGKPIIAREGRRIKFTHSVKLRNKLKEE